MKLSRNHSLHAQTSSNSNHYSARPSSFAELFLQQEAEEPLRNVRQQYTPHLSDNAQQRKKSSHSHHQMNKLSNLLAQYRRDSATNNTGIAEALQDDVQRDYCSLPPSNSCKPLSAQNSKRVREPLSTINMDYNLVLAGSNKGGGVANFAGTSSNLNKPPICTNAGGGRTPVADSSNVQGGSKRSSKAQKLNQILNGEIADSDNYSFLNLPKKTSPFLQNCDNSSIEVSSDTPSSLHTQAFKKIVDEQNDKISQEMLRLIAQGTVGSKKMFMENAQQQQYQQQQQLQHIPSQRVTLSSASEEIVKVHQRRELELLDLKNTLLKCEIEKRNAEKQCRDLESEIRELKKSEANNINLNRELEAQQNKCRQLTATLEETQQSLQSQVQKLKEQLRLLQVQRDLAVQKQETAELQGKGISERNQLLESQLGLLKNDLTKAQEEVARQKNVICNYVHIEKKVLEFDRQQSALIEENVSLRRKLEQQPSQLKLGDCIRQSLNAVKCTGEQLSDMHELLAKISRLACSLAHQEEPSLECLVGHIKKKNNNNCVEGGQLRNSRGETKTNLDENQLAMLNSEELLQETSRAQTAAQKLGLEMRRLLDEMSEVYLNHLGSQFVAGGNAPSLVAGGGVFMAPKDEIGAV